MPGRPPVRPVLRAPAGRAAAGSPSCWLPASGPLRCYCCCCWLPEAPSPCPARCALRNGRRTVPTTSPAVRSAPPSALGRTPEWELFLLGLGSTHVLLGSGSAQPPGSPGATSYGPPLWGLRRTRLFFFLCAPSRWRRRLSGMGMRSPGPWGTSPAKKLSAATTGCWVDQVGELD